MNPWTQDRVLALAPDSASASAGQGLASTKKWTLLARSDRAVWGLCQGSGKDPYQARIDLSEPAFKCSCPSRKFPCKHGIGLMLLFAKDQTFFKADAEPGWVTDWLAGRTQRAEKKAEKAAEPPKPVDAEAQAKRAAQRESRVQDGVAECRTWLEDLLRRGLAAAQSERESFWERVSARMVDAQAPGLARLIRQLPAAIATGEGWHHRTLDRLGRIHLLLRAAERIDELPQDLAADVRVALGRTQSKDEALATEPVADRWCVLAQVTEEEDRLRVRRTWLHGRASGRRALVLDFAAGAQPLDASLVAGTEFDGELAYYAARLPLRALVKSRTGPVAAFSGVPANPASFDQELTAYARAIATTPWLERWPMILSSVTPAPDPPGGRWSLWDHSGRGLPVRPGFPGAWRLLSISGGRPISLMAEWDGEFLLPLATWSETQSSFVDLSPRWAA